MKRIESFDFESLDKEKYKYFITGNDFNYDELYEKNGYLICIEVINGIKFLDVLEIERQGAFEVKQVFDELFKNNEKLGISYQRDSKIKILAKRLKQIYVTDQELELQDLKGIIFRKGGSSNGKRKSDKKNFKSTK